MNKKKSCLVSSTPHPDRTRQLFSLFDSIEFSPITENAGLIDHVDSQPKTENLPSDAQRKGAVKRRVATKEKAAPESVTAGVLKELGVKAQDVCNNALSHSRNLYNMFPEPIILDSDEEENCTIPKQPIKKPKQDNRVVTIKKQEENKTKDPVPGSSRTTTTHLTRPTAHRKLRKLTSAQTLNNVPSCSKDLKPTTKTKPQTKNKPLIPSSENSVVIIDEDDDNLFPEYQPGTSETTIRIKIKEKGRFSIDIDEKFPITWSQRRQKIDKTEEVLDTENILVHDENSEIGENNIKTGTTKQKISKHTTRKKREEVPDLENMKICESNKPEKNNIKKEPTKPSGKSKGGVLTRSAQSHNIDKRVENKDEDAVNGEQECLVQISRFEDVKFKKNKTCGGIVAKCLKTDQNDVGYIEVHADDVFNGQSSNVTFVVIEGEAKVLHSGEQFTLSPGDMVHIKSGSNDGYQLMSAGAGHVRFLFIKSSH